MEWEGTMSATKGATDPLSENEYRAFIEGFVALVATEYRQVLVSNRMPESVRRSGDASMLKIATRKVARSIWLPVEARQPEKEYGRS